MSSKGIRTERTNKRKMTSKTNTEITTTPDLQNIDPEGSAPGKSARKSKKSRKSAQITVGPNEKAGEEVESITTSAASKNSNVDFVKRGYYNAEKDEILNERYIIQEMLGSGKYASVHKAMDKRTKNTVALKIVRCEERFTDASKKEIEFLKKIKEVSGSSTESSPGSNNIVSLLDFFEHKTNNDDMHLVMVLEMLGPDLNSILCKSNQKILTLNRIQRFSKDILKGLEFLHSNCKIMHLDLKPENLLVTVDPKNMNLADPKCSASLKIGDFGLSDYSTGIVNRTVQTCHYRAPEVFLNVQLTPAADIWSFGCTLYEMAKRSVLFECNGPNNCISEWHVDNISDLLMDVLIRYSKKNEKNADLFEKGLKKNNNLKITSRICPEELTKVYPVMTDSQAKMFSEFLRKVLVGRPDERLSVEEALEHPFLLEEKEDCRK